MRGRVVGLLAAPPATGATWKSDPRAIAFLLSDLSSHITGQTILVDGGLNLKWTHLGADNTSLFLKNEDFRAAIKQ